MAISIECNKCAMEMDKIESTLLVGVLLIKAKCFNCNHEVIIRLHVGE